MKRMAGLAVLLLAFAVPMRLAANDSNGNCYPTNSSVSAAAQGATSAKGEARGALEEIEVERHGQISSNAADKVSIEFSAAITGANTTANPGTATGRAEARVHWNNALAGGITETYFESGCVFEIGTAPQTGTKGVGELEVEYEGWVKDFPGYPGTRKAAVLSIVVTADANNPGKLELDFTIELNTDCLENVYVGGDNDIELGKVALPNLDPEEFKITNDAPHGLVSAPDTQTHGCQ
jgi:hypothetical protein